MPASVHHLTDFAFSLFSFYILWITKAGFPGRWRVTTWTLYCAAVCAWQFYWLYPL